MKKERMERMMEHDNDSLVLDLSNKISALKGVFFVFVLLARACYSIILSTISLSFTWSHSTNGMQHSSVSFSVLIRGHFPNLSVCSSLFYVCLFIDINFLIRLLPAHLVDCGHRRRSEKSERILG